MLLALGARIQETTFNEWKPVYCPFHPDGNASASVNPYLGAFNCHGCDVRGDIVNLAKEHLGTQDTKEAMDWLREEFL